MAAQWHFLILIPFFKCIIPFDNNELEHLPKKVIRRLLVRKTVCILKTSVVKTQRERSPDRDLSECVS